MRNLIWVLALVAIIFLVRLLFANLVPDVIDVNDPVQVRNTFLAFFAGLMLLGGYTFAAFRTALKR